MIRSWSSCLSFRFSIVLLHMPYLLAALTSSQQSTLRLWVEKTTFDASTCPGANDAPTDTERDYASEAMDKFFEFDTHNADSWAGISTLQTCLERVANKTWLGGKANLYEASKAAFATFGQSTSDSYWDGCCHYTENNPVRASASVLSSDANTGPMKFYHNASRNSSMHQPCNALSNAAYFHIPLEVCRVSVFPSLAGSFTWADEVMAMGTALALGSFTMHSNPYTAGGPPNGWRMSTQDMDTGAMDALFLLFHHASVYNLASASTSAESLSVVLSLGGLAPVDVRPSVHNLIEAFAGDIAGWQTAVTSAKASLPAYMLPALGIVLVNLYIIFNEEVFGTAGLHLYELVCTHLFKAMMPQETSQVNSFCVASSPWVRTLKSVAWKVPKSIKSSLQNLFWLLETLVEAFFWQETKASPQSGGFTDYYPDGAVSATEAECWKVPHANWHRAGALLARRLVKAFAFDVPALVQEPPLGLAAKQKAWEDAPAVAPYLQVIYNSVKAMSSARSVNVCRVFKLARECALASPPCGRADISFLLSPKGANEVLSGLLSDYNKFEDIMSASGGPFEDSMGACQWSYEATLKKVEGLSAFALDTLSVNTAYVEGSTTDSTVIRTTLAFKTCALPVKIEGDAILSTSGSGSFTNMMCSKGDSSLIVKASLLLSVDANVSLDADLNKILSGSTDPFSIDLSQLDIRCHDLTLLPPTDGWHNKLSYSIVNAGMDSGVTTAACTIISQLIKKEAKAQLTAQAKKMGEQVSTAMGGGRRLQTCPDLEATMKSMWGESAYNEYLKSGVQRFSNGQNGDGVINIDGAPRVMPFTVVIALAISVACARLSLH
eukprot:TRINITY_DN27417_c0_g1_i1.p1 TRINITY_DN27417_c0_g1~~TRINITY_DN27417_c0_g1_i1.p1  ORF type:complete len:835 (-),score=96.05 TRINITY_DN27417_c0_g1_i1:306-2810(-)